MDTGVERLSRIGLTVGDLSGACRFYTDALGFREVERGRRTGPAFAALTGVDGASAQAAVLRLGRQEIELLAFDPPGRVYPARRAANDPWFQHFAIVTADMDASAAAVAAGGGDAVSQGGPVRLPPETGGIVAYKFRDPEGHPLELSWFPAAVAAPPWRDPPPGAVALGVDHSAIAVRDVEASLRFYVETLGLHVAGRQVNTGPTQARLDGLAGATVEIVTLQTPAGGVHMELLAYREPAPPAPGPPLRVDDIAATRLVFEVPDLTGLAARLAATGRGLVSNGVVAMADGRRAMLARDPDGHLIELHAI